MRKDKLIDFLIYTSIFVDSIVFFKSPFEGYLHYFIFLLFLPSFINRYGLPKIPFKILALPVITSIFQVLMGNDEWFLFFKIFFGMILSITFFYYVILYYNYDIEKMFSLYLKWAYWTAVIGIVQYVSFKIHFSLGWNYSWILNKGGGLAGDRISSIYLEPSQLGIMLAPAAFVAITNFIRKEKYEFKNYQNYIILIAIYLCKSSTGYIGIFFIIFIIGLNLGYISYLLMFVIIGFMGAYAAYSNIDEFKSRVDAAKGLWVNNNFSIENVNTSSFVQYNNAHIAFENFKEHPFFGTGLGSHPVAFAKYSYTKTGLVKDIVGFGNNSADANSLFLRLMSETGLIGMLFMLAIIFKCFVGNDNIDNRYWIISGSILVLIFLYLFRQGNYFLNGFPFFVWLYYYNKKAYLEEKENRLETNKTTV